jgi:hypothetical protein
MRETTKRGWKRQEGQTRRRNGDGREEFNSTRFLSSLDSITRLGAVERFKLVKPGELNTARPNTEDNGSSKEGVDKISVGEVRVSLHIGPTMEKTRRNEGLRVH